jgi:hypothetical protein
VDIAELFSRDPLLYTEDDLTHIVTEMRKSRASFNLGSVKAGSTKAPTAKQKALGELASSLKIEI